MQGLLSGFCVMVSRALQRGDDPSQMLDGTIGVMPFPPSGFAFTRTDIESKKLGSVPSVTYLIIKAVEWAVSDFSEDFVWSQDGR